MINKRIYLLMLFAISVLSLTSCSDALNVAPQGSVTLDQTFADNDKVGAFLNTCYANVPEKGLHYFFTSRGPVEWCDEAWDADDLAVYWGASAMLYAGNAHGGFDAIDDQPGDIECNYWTRYWESIHNCALFLSRIGTATVKSESDRKRWTAEAHTLRAYYYSELLKWYGCALPLEDQPYALTQNFGKTQRASYYNVVKFIMADCDSAINNTELPWRITVDQQGGRATKALAEAIKSRMILFAASPLYNDNNNYWEEAYEVNKDALQKLKDNGYQLYQKVNYPQIYESADAYLPNADAALYNEYFTTSMSYTSNPIDQETIFQGKDDQPAPWLFDGVGAQHQYKTGTCPSQELVDSYETTDGKPVLNLSTPYQDEQHTLPNYTQGTLYDPNNPYANRDPRFYASIYYNGSKRKCQWNFAEVPASIENYPAPMGNRVRIIATWDGEPQTGWDLNSRTVTRTGYYERKFVHPFSGDDYGVNGAKTKLFRLGEIYLNFAEAAAMTGNHDAEAIDAVNKIRERVHMPDLPSNIEHADLILRIKNERRVELAMEENRYFDIRRWTSPSGDLSATDKWVGAMVITRNGDGSFTYTRRPVRTTERKCYTNKYLKLPLNQTEANLMQSITGEVWQNPGW